MGLLNNFKDSLVSRGAAYETQVEQVPEVVRELARADCKGDTHDWPGT